jgi:hypothetical protein
MDDGVCERVRISAMATEQGETAEFSADVIQSHLARCPGCREHIDASRETEGLLARARRTRVKVDVWSEIREHIARDADPDIDGRHQSRIPPLESDERRVARSKRAAASEHSLKRLDWDHVFWQALSVALLALVAGLFFLFSDDGAGQANGPIRDPLKTEVGEKGRKKAGEVAGDPKEGSEEKEDKPDPLIPSSQDREVMKKAWRARVRLNHKDTTLHAVVADLARQSKIDIRVDKEAVEQVLTHSSSQGQSGSSGFLSVPGRKDRGRAFLDAEEVQRLSRVSFPVKYTGGRLDSAICAADIPLPMALAAICRTWRVAYSYRKGHVLISTNRVLLPELLITRKFQLKHTWGSIYEVNYNGKDMRFRLDLLDSVARLLLNYHPFDREDKAAWAARHFDGPNPAGAFERLKSLGRGIKVKFDKTTKTLSLTAHPQAIQCFKGNGIAELNRPSPEALAAEAAAFKRSHLLKAATDAWEDLTADAREAVKRHVAGLGNETYEVRRKSEEALIRLGPAAAFPLLKKSEEKPILEARRRRARVLDRIYAELLSNKALARARAYLDAGMAGDFDRIHDTIWSRRRRESYRQWEASFRRELEATRGDPSSLKAFRKEHGFKADTPAERLSVRARTLREMNVKSARIEAVRFSGPNAEVTFSVDLNPDHPHYAGFQSIKKMGVESPISTFVMTCEDHRWMAGSERFNYCEAAGITWTRKGGLSGAGIVPLAGKTQGGGSATDNSVSLHASAFAYAIGFGY